MGITSYDWPHLFFKVPRVVQLAMAAWQGLQCCNLGADSGICIEHFSNADYGDDEGQGAPLCSVTGVTTAECGLGSLLV